MPDFDYIDATTTTVTEEINGLLDGSTTPLTVAGVAAVDDDYPAADLATALDVAAGIYPTPVGQVDNTVLVVATDAVAWSASPLDTAAFTAATDYATAAQGATADTAVQPADLATIDYTPADTNNWTGADPTTIAGAIDRIAAALGPIA